MERLSLELSGDASGARRQAHDAALARGSAMPSSFIRTMTVGSGIGPDLLTLRQRVRGTRRLPKALAGSSLGDLPPVGNCTPP